MTMVNSGLKGLNEVAYEFHNVLAFISSSCLSRAKAKGFTMDEIYTKPYTRINVYLVGMLTGFILVHTKAQITFKKVSI